jgi:protein arginine kinase activator
MNGMLCRICKEKEATVHLTQISGEEMQKMDLCEACAKTRGVNDPAGFSMADLLLGLSGAQQIKPPGGGGIHP